jgi:hypothetical protein
LHLFLFPFVLFLSFLNTLIFPRIPFFNIKIFDYDFYYFKKEIKITTEQIEIKTNIINCITKLKYCGHSQKNYEEAFKDLQKHMDLEEELFKNQIEIKKNITKLLSSVEDSVEKLS